jgi:hypothetical protein
MSKRPKRSTCLRVVSASWAINSIAPSMLTRVTAAASANFHVRVRTSRWRASRSRSSGSSAAIGSATRNPTSSTARSSASAVVAPGIYVTTTVSVA